MKDSNNPCCKNCHFIFKKGTNTGRQIGRHKCEKRSNEMLESLVSNESLGSLESLMRERIASIREHKEEMKGIGVSSSSLLKNPNDTNTEEVVDMDVEDADDEETKPRDATSIEEAEEDLRQRIAAIKLPKSGEFLKVEKLFKVEGDLDMFFTSIENQNSKTLINNTTSLTDVEKTVFKKGVNERYKISDTGATITNYVGNRGARLMMDSTFMMDSKYHYLAPMKLILEFIEGLTWTNEQNVEQKYKLQYNYIFNTEASVAQKAHTDYKKDNGINKKGNALPFTIFFGIRQNSKLIIWNRTLKQYQTINYGVGDVLFLAGDVIHAGPTYLEAHGRMQLYADTNVIHNPLNPNEWFSVPFSEQPLAYELDEDIYNDESFHKAINESALKRTYNVSKKDIIKKLKL